MSKNCNGARINSNKKLHRSSRVTKRTRSFAVPKEDFPPEEAFRGFEKLPFVALSRLDITPYLKSKDNTVETANAVTQALTTRHLERAVQICKVAVINDDLERLKRSVSGSKDRGSDTECSSEETGNMEVKCKICEKVYSSEKKLQNHQHNKHMIVYRPNGKSQKRVSFSDHVIVHEVKEYHKCRKCSKIFETYKTLKSHMKSKHKKRKCYICNYCHKNFIDRMFFKVHIKMHCDVCGLLLPTKTKYAEHRRNVCRILKQYNCRTCDITFFKFMDLKDHSYEHLNTYFICDICKDQLNTKCAVSHHISFLHSEQRPTSLYGMRNLGNERLYLCNFCEQSSVDKEVIEAHVQTLPDLTNKAMTGYKDYYFCDQCLKKFECETDMLQHKWSHFLNTTDNSQERTDEPKGVLAKKRIVKTTYSCNEEIPEYMKPIVVVERLQIDAKDLSNMAVSLNINSLDLANGTLKRAIVDPKRKKTILSRFKCQQCGKFYSSNYCLNRHIESQHSDYTSLCCHVCKQTFLWPSLLRSHRCITQMSYEDTSPEIHFDNVNEITDNSFDISESDYLNSVDFEIPAPIVELTEYDSSFHVRDDSVLSMVDKNYCATVGYKLIMQEVPIEF